MTLTYFLFLVLGFLFGGFIVYVIHKTLTIPDAYFFINPETNKYTLDLQSDIEKIKTKKYFVVKNVKM